MEDVNKIEDHVEEPAAVVESIPDTEVVEEVHATTEVEHEVTQEDLEANPNLVTEGVKVGDVIKLPMLVNEADIEAAKAEHAATLVTQEWLDAHPDSALQVGDAIPTDAAAAAIVEEAPVTPIVMGGHPKTAEYLMYMGKKVANAGTRVVNEITYNHLVLEDGSTHDLTNQEYVDNVTVVQ